MKISVLIPTLNAGPLWQAVLDGISAQSFPVAQKIIIDSGSTDTTVNLATENGFEVITINKDSFNHGKTRQQLVDLAINTDICVFLTQDAILSSPNGLLNLISVFDDPEIGMAYGRQLPQKNARPIEIHLREFNYPPVSNFRVLKDKETLGFKIFFCSNSFAAYRKSALNEIGGFPTNSIMGEDAIVAAKMLLKGYKKAYVASAEVYHSHNYSFAEEFKRYFDTRVFHEQNKWLIDEFGKPTGEGVKFVKSQLQFALKYGPLSVIKSITSILAKYLGYNSGRFYKKMPLPLLKKLSMHSFYWK